MRAAFVPDDAQHREFARARAEGALTRCFDLLKVDNDLISKSREILNRGERSGG